MSSASWRRRSRKTAPSGRGLPLVGALANRRGTEPRGSGKALWCGFTVPVAGGEAEGRCGEGYRPASVGRYPGKGDIRAT
ncbi:hypothetical protein JCM4914_02860 [Streptomyces platensis subsp. malvinus]